MKNLKVFKTQIIVSWNKTISTRNSIEVGLSFRNIGDVSFTLKFPDRDLVTISMMKYSFNSVSATFLEVYTTGKNKLEFDQILRHQSTRISSEYFVSVDVTFQIYSSIFGHECCASSQVDSGKMEKDD